MLLNLVHLFNFFLFFHLLSYYIVKLSVWPVNLALGLLVVWAWSRGVRCGCVLVGAGSGRGISPGGVACAGSVGALRLRLGSVAVFARGLWLLGVWLCRRAR